MKKTIVILMLVCCLSVGCGSRDRGFESPVSEIVGDDVTTVSVSHIVSGQMTEWVISGETVEAVRTWINGLECRREQFEEGNTPGDMDGGEAYGFVFAGENKSEFSYIINGSNDCYLLMEGEWYSVRNPSDPPVMEEEMPQEAGAGQEDDWGLTLRAESVSATGCTVVFIQHGGAPTGELESGTWYRIEKKEGDEWVEMPYAQGIGDEIGWNSVAWCIPGEGSVEFEEDWSFLYGELTPGTYRIVKEITDFRSSGDYDAKWYYAEFSVTEERVPVRSENPPLLTVISDESAHDALLGTYSWQRENGDGTSTGIEVDHAHPLDCEAWLPPLETTCQTVVLRFAEEPDRIVSVRCWSDENWSDPTAESEGVTIMGNEIELKIGGYIYEVTAEWNKESGYGGTAHYSFYVKRSE